MANSSVSWVLPRKIRIIKSRKLFKFSYLLLVRMGFGSLTKVEQKKLLKLFGLFLALGLVLLFILPGSVKSGRLPIWTPWIILSMYHLQLGSDVLYEIECAPVFPQIHDSLFLGIAHLLLHVE